MNLRMRLVSMPVVLAAVLLLALGACGSPHSQASVRSGELTISGMWVAATPRHANSPGHGHGTSSAMSAAYTIIDNHGSAADELVAASTDAADEVQLHTTITKPDGSSGTMTRISGIRVPAGGSVSLEPGKWHLMLMGLRHDLVAGKPIVIRLSFRSGTRIDVTFPVVDRADRPRSRDS